MITRLRCWILVALIIFLPLSAWLVSLTGQNWVGLGRDLLLVIFMLFSVADWFTTSKVEGRSPRRPTVATYLAIIFVLLVLGSYFHHQDSIEQWLRGVRYLTEPLLLFVAIQISPPILPTRILWRTLALSTGLVVLGAIIEWLNPALLRATLDATGRGYLGQIHLAEGLTRFQSTLAGPNALGLFLMVALLLFPLWQKTVPKYLALSVGVLGLAAMLVTFSRSSYTGLLFGGAMLVTAGGQVLGKSARLLTVSFVTLLVLIGALLLARPEELVRTTSNTMRLEQYERVWEQRGEIGWWGRGAGAAGLVSVSRLDGGPNFYTENTYLDAYETLGGLGLLAYLGFWVVLIRSLLFGKTIASLAVGAAALGLAVAGLFINHYTGQAAIWLLLLFAGLTLSQKNGAEGSIEPINDRAV